MQKRVHSRSKHPVDQVRQVARNGQLLQLGLHFHPAKLLLPLEKTVKADLLRSLGFKKIVTLLLLTATGEILTLCVATIVPVRSLIITRAGTSGFTSIPPMRPRN